MKIIVDIDHCSDITNLMKLGEVEGFYDDVYLVGSEDTNIPAKVLSVAKNSYLFNVFTFGSQAEINKYIAEVLHTSWSDILIVSEVADKHISAIAGMIALYREFNYHSDNLEVATSGRQAFNLVVDKIKEAERKAEEEQEQTEEAANSEAEEEQTEEAANSEANESAE